MLTTPEADVHIKGDPLGRAYTPDHVALVIMQRLRTLWPEGTTLSVVEPCAGGGAFLRAALSSGPVLSLLARDVDPAAPALADDRWQAQVRDATAHVGDAAWDLAVTNPPFGKAVGQRTTLAIVDRMREAANVAAVLVPLGYLGQTGWADRVASCRHVWPVVGRVWEHEREMVVLVWDRRFGERNVPTEEDDRLRFLRTPTNPAAGGVYNNHEGGVGGYRDPASPKVQAAERKRAMRAAKRLGVAP